MVCEWCMWGGAVLCKGHQCSNGLGWETLLTFGHTGKESFARSLEFIARVVIFYDLLIYDFPGSGGATPGVDVLQGGQCLPGGALKGIMATVFFS